MNPVEPENCTDQQKETLDTHSSRPAPWVEFCKNHEVAKNPAPLFDCDEAGFVRTRQIGNPLPHKFLCRSKAMENMMCQEVRKAVDSHKSAMFQYDGIIYVMYTLSPDGGVVPRYIGKAETMGKKPPNLSANLLRLETDRSKFGRWGDGYAYHIGDLSAVVLPGHDSEKQLPKYKSWAKALFHGVNLDRPRLIQPVFLWVKAWRMDDIGWHEFGPTRLSFLEYLLIGYASALFPSEVLNQEGHNRDISII